MVWHLLPRLNGFLVRPRQYILAIDHFLTCPPSVVRYLDFTVSKITPTMVTNLGWKLFMTFATINILGGCAFALLIPETKNKSLEEMDIIFGSISQERRHADISRVQHGAFLLLLHLYIGND